MKIVGIADMTSKVFARSPDLVARSIEGEEILVPIVHSGDEVDSIYTLNEVGKFIWERIDGERTFKDIIDAVKDEYEGKAGHMERSVETFVRDLLEIRAISEKS